MKRRLLILPLLVTVVGCGDTAAPGKSDDGPSTGEVAASAARLPLDAAGLPLLRAGLWEHTERRGDEVETRRVCRAAGVDKATSEFLVGPLRPGCTRTGRAAKSGLAVSVQCRTDAMTIETSIELSGDEANIRSTMVTSVTGADGVATREKVEAESRWLSSCPEGMSAGDKISEDDLQTDH